MRWKLLRRRLTISAPRMKVRSAMPWPLRWAGVAIMLGFCAAISLGAFELGKDLAGVDTNDKEQLAALREENARLREERDKAQSTINTSGVLATAERSAQAGVFLSQRGQLFLVVGVDPGEVLAELEGPQRNGGAEPQHDGHAGPAQRPGHGAPDSDLGGTDGQPAT